jgi:hypothetical protein
MAGKSFARCSSLPRAATEGNALQRDRQYYRTQDDTAASSAIRTAWAGAQTESGNAARQTGVSAEPLPTTPEFQGDPQAAPPPFQTAHGKGATQRPGVLAAPLTALKPPRFQGDCNAAAPPHGEGAIRSRRATIPLTARRKVIESGKRRKRPVVRYSAVPWHGIATMRNLPQHRGKAVANRCAAGCRRSIPDCDATDRGRMCPNRGRSVTEQRTNSGRSNAFWEYCPDLLTLRALVFASVMRYRSVIHNRVGSCGKPRRNVPTISRCCPHAMRTNCGRNADKIVWVTLRPSPWRHPNGSETVPKRAGNRCETVAERLRKGFNLTPPDESAWLTRG